MNDRLDYMTVAPEAAGALFEVSKRLAKSGLEKTLLTLVDLRASQINGCAFCLALHTREAHAVGESNDRLSGLPAWRDAPWYTQRERAALEWTEALTLLGRDHVSRDLLAKLKEHFSEREIVFLTLAIALINSWNRFNVAFGTSPEGADAVFAMLHPEREPATA